jgi:hypothetical protein
MTKNYGGLHKGNNIKIKEILIEEMLFLIFFHRDWTVCGQCCKFQPCKLKVFEDI